MAIYRMDRKCIKDFRKQYIPFSDIRYNFNNPPTDNAVLIFQPQTKELMLFANCEYIKINTNAFDNAVLHDKFDPHCLPQSLATKFWVSQQINQKIKDAFILKGVKQHYIQLKTIRNAKPGDVWLCIQKKSWYVYTKQKHWESLSNNTSFDFQQIQNMLLQISELQKNVVKNRVSIQCQINRAKTQQAGIRQLLHQIDTVNKSNLNNQVSRAKSVQQMLSAAIMENKVKVGIAVEKLSAIDQLLSSVNTSTVQVSAKVNSLNSLLNAQTEAVRQLYTNIDVVRQITVADLREQKEYVNDAITQLSSYVNDKTDNALSFVQQAIRVNNIQTNQKLDNLSSSVLHSVDNILTQSQIRINAAISAAGIVQLSGIPTQIATLHTQISGITSQVENMQTNITNVTAAVAAVDDKLQVVSSELTEQILQEKLQRNLAVLSSISSFDDQFIVVNEKIDTIVDMIELL